MKNKVTNRIYIVRYKQRIKQYELAKLVGISPTNMGYIERGVVRPHIDIALKIAKVLKVNINYLFKLE